MLIALESVLEQARQRKKTITYLEAADALMMPGPHRIHKTALLLEEQLRRDSKVGRAPRSALVVSRTRSGRPAPGFFACAQQLGLFDGNEPNAFHDRLLSQLFRRTQP